jgi:hypothetical protein
MCNCSIPQSPSTATTGSEQSEEKARNQSGVTTAYREVVVSGECDSITEVVLGLISAILLLTLVGVIIGWVWSCHRNKATKQEHV